MLVSEFVSLFLGSSSSGVNRLEKEGDFQQRVKAITPGLAAKEKKVADFMLTCSYLIMLTEKACISFKSTILNLEEYFRITLLTLDSLKQSNISLATANHVKKFHQQLDLKTNWTMQSIRSAISELLSSAEQQLENLKSENVRDLPRIEN